MSRIHVIVELFLFLRESRKYWLTPILIVLLLVGFMLLVANSSAITPFIYALF